MPDAEPAPGQDAAGAENGAEGGGRVEQSAEQNAQFAAARRKAERDARLEAERIREEEGRKQDALIAGLGFTNPETGLPVRTRAEYAAMQEATARQKNADLARRAGMSEEEWNRHVEQAPAVVEARAMQKRAAAAEQAARMEQVRVQMQEELAEIAKLDGTVKTFDDLRASEGWPQMEAMMRRGYGMLDAYKLPNYEALGERRAAAARHTAPAQPQLPPRQARSLAPARSVRARTPWRAVRSRGWRAETTP
jgi:hypothetical protein